MDPFAIPSGEGLPAPEYREAVVHLASEYWPYARTGGLAEAVRGIARYQAAAGADTLVFLPLYRSARQTFPDIVPCCKPFEVRVGDRTETAVVHHHPEAPPNPRILFVEHEGFFDRPGLYSAGGADYPDNHLRFALIRNHCVIQVGWRCSSR